jgi:methyltransferase-like protein/2-polyprenyl-3-methyl-5-hydroxy-6-metoxy-1,4-benzoquinol methylase
LGVGGNRRAHNDLPGFQQDWVAQSLRQPDQTFWPQVEFVAIERISVRPDTEDDLEAMRMARARSRGGQSAVDDLRAAYDEAPYESYAQPQSAPGQLAAIAWAFGLDPPDVNGARVLEIGCAAAGNLIPFAAMHPLARTVGIDLSQVQIEQGRRRVRALGLDNVELIHSDIADIAYRGLAAMGQFDFIICHGVYSWVPDQVQEAILAACGQLLSPAGVAYVGYNTYPGWKAKEIVRDAMLLSVGDSTRIDEKLYLARSMVDFLGKVAQPDSVLARALNDYQLMAAAAGDYYLLHEELEIFNAPCYFRDFVYRARAHGLDYLAEAKPEYSFASNYGPTVADHLLDHADDQILLEQHLDFVVNRHFRQTLLVRAERAPQISRRLDRTRCRRMHFAASLPSLTGETRLDDSSQQYGDPDGSNLVTRDAGLKAAIDALTDRWPWTLSWQELVDAARARLARVGIEVAPDFEARIDRLLECLIIQGQARYRLAPVLPEPACTPLRLNEAARRMAELTREDTDAFIFNHWHELLPLSPVDRHLLPLLDGCRDRQALVEALMDVVDQDLIRIDRDDGQVLDEDGIRDVLAQQVDALPQRLTEMKLMSVCDYTSVIDHRRPA